MYIRTYSHSVVHVFVVYAGLCRGILQEQVYVYAYCSTFTVPSSEKGMISHVSYAKTAWL